MAKGEKNSPNLRVPSLLDFQPFLGVFFPLWTFDIVHHSLHVLPLLCAHIVLSQTFLQVLGSGLGLRRMEPCKMGPVTVSLDLIRALRMRA